MFRPGSNAASTPGGEHLAPIREVEEPEEEHLTPTPVSTPIIANPAPTPVSIDVFSWQHTGHAYVDEAQPFEREGVDIVIPRRFSQPLELRSRHYLVLKTYNDEPRPRITCTFVSDGCFGDRFWTSSGEHGFASGFFKDGQLHPTELSFSFAGVRGAAHDVMVTPIPCKSKDFQVFHRGRGGHRPIPALYPWALMTRVNGITLGSDERFDRLRTWLLNRPLLSNRDIDQFLHDCLVQ